MEQGILLLHIASGLAGLFGGLLASLARKKKGLHSRAGDVFFYGMLISLISALLLNIIRFSPFLFPIALFTLYMILGGKLIFTFRSPKILEKWWRYYSFLGMLISLLMIGTAVSLFIKNLWAMAAILIVFGIIQSLMTLADWRNNPGRTPEKRIFQHINKMGGGLIAAFTAFAAVNIHFLPALLVWLMPSLIGSILIAYAIQQRKKTTRL